MTPCNECDVLSHILPATTDAGWDASRASAFVRMALLVLRISDDTTIAGQFAGHELAALLEGRASTRMKVASKLRLNVEWLNGLDSKTRCEVIEAMIKVQHPSIVGADLETAIAALSRVRSERVAEVALDNMRREWTRRCTRSS